MASLKDMGQEDKGCFCLFFEKSNPLWIIVISEFAFPFLLLVQRIFHNNNF